MKRTFRVHRRQRLQLWVGLAVFIFAAVGGLFLAGDVPLDRRLWALLFCHVFWDCWIVLAICALIDCYRDLLEISDGRLIQRGWFGQIRAVRLSDVVELRWRKSRSDVLLRSPDGKLKIGFDSFEPDERIWLIRWLRASVPDGVESVWPEYCERWAAGWLNEPTERALLPNEIRVTRSRYDRIFPLIIAAVTLGSIFVASYIHCWPVLIAPLPFAAAWLFLRFTIPSAGQIQTKSSGWEHTLFLYVWVFGCGLLMALLGTVPKEETLRTAIISIGVVGLIAVFVPCMWRETARERATLPAKITAAEARWNAAESADG